MNSQGSSPTSSPAPNCPRCGARVPAHAPAGLCPRCFIASWPEGSVKLRESTNPVNGEWRDTDRPFTETEDALGIRTAVELDPRAGDPIRYFRLVESR